MLEPTNFRIDFPIPAFDGNWTAEDLANHKVNHYPSGRVNAVCVHRSEQVGYVDCKCNGNRKVYQCGKLFRPDVSPAESAFCIPFLPVTRLKVLGMDGKTEIARLQHHELLMCSPLCDMYESES